MLDGNEHEIDDMSLEAAMAFQLMLQIIRISLNKDPLDRQREMQNRLKVLAEVQEKQSEARYRVIEYLRTGIKPEGFESHLSIFETRGLSKEAKQTVNMVQQLAYDDMQKTQKISLQKGMGLGKQI